MQQIVLPNKDSNVLKEVQDTLLNSFRTCLESYKGPNNLLQS